MNEKEMLYPLLFNPVYKRVVWGGSQLEKYLRRKDLPQGQEEPVGESWEICDRPGVVSIVANGGMAGKNIQDLIQFYGKDLLGTKWNGGRFPLLVKLIDAGKRLSLQVHPGEVACAQIGGGAEPKTEMWYILHAEHGAKIFAGLLPNTTRVKFLTSISSSDCEDSLRIFDSKPGDAYFIPAGRVHAIGAGNLLLEIQQNSDTTYRISDWGRVGSDGKPRELHVEQAKRCIDYNDRTVPRITSPANAADHNRKYQVVTSCPFFHVEDLRLVQDWTDRTTGESFHLLTSVNNVVKVSFENGLSEMIPVGRTTLIPACTGAYSVSIPDRRPATIVKTTL